jgi:hypothetical protein
MKIFAAIRRRFRPRESEKEALKFLTNVIACQIGALVLKEGVDPHRLMRIIAGNKTIRAYFLGLAWYANDTYRIDDFEWVLHQVGATLNHVLHSRNPNVMEVLARSFKPDYRDVLLDSWNSERKQFDNEFKNGWEMALMDIAVYLSEGAPAFERQYQMKMDDMGSLVEALAPKLLLFQLVKRVQD